MASFQVSLVQRVKYYPQNRPVRLLAAGRSSRAKMKKEKREMRVKRKVRKKRNMVEKASCIICGETNCACACGDV